MPASVLPAISKSCNFKLSDYIETEEKAHIATEITKKAYENADRFDNIISSIEKEASIVKEDPATYGIDIADEIKDYFIRHEEVGGHLFAIASQWSLESGYDGVITGFAANENLLSHYQKAFGAIKLGILHQYHLMIDEINSSKIREVYDYEWTDEKI